MRFTLRALFYATAHVGIALAAFGSAGIVLSAIVIAVWAYVLRQDDRPRALGQAVVAVIIALCGAGLLMPAVSTVRESSRRARCSNNLKYIALAMHEYHERFGTFPPAYIPDASGKPMHSWRVLLLPCLESGKVYSQYDFAEPWDGPNNRKLIAQGPYTCLCPGSNSTLGQTDYFVVNGAAAFPDGHPSRHSDLGDATLLLIESRNPDVAWSEPRDLTREEALAALTSTTTPACHVREHFFFHDDVGFNVALLDTSIHFIFHPMDQDDAVALLSAKGLDVSRIDEMGGYPRPRRLRWSRIISCSLLLVLTLWPLKYCWQRKPE